jgi:hypothetical protein
MTFRYQETARHFSEELVRELEEHAALKEASQAVPTKSTSTGGLVKALNATTPLQQVRNIISMKNQKTASETLLEYRAREAVRGIVDNQHQRLDDFLVATSEK